MALSHNSMKNNQQVKELIFMGNTIDFNIRVDSDIKKQSEASMVI